MHLLIVGRSAPDGSVLGPNFGDAATIGPARRRGAGGALKALARLHPGHIRAYTHAGWGSP